jgi:hypothetical protein
MKKSKLRYPLIVAASLLCLGLTIFALQTPPQNSPPSAPRLERPVELVDQAVGMIEDSLRQQRP